MRGLPMSDFENKVLEVCHSRYQAIFGEYNSTSSQKILIAHFGEFSQDLVNSITNQAEELMIEAGDKKGTVKRIFSILVEGLQNIRLHGARDKDGNQASFFILAQDEEEYRITFGNLVRNEVMHIIDERIEQINGYDEQTLKAHYMEVLTNGIISNKGGAGLGFITVAMKSKSKIDHLFEEIDESLSCFTVNVKVQRRKK